MLVYTGIAMNNKYSLFFTGFRSFCNPGGCRVAGRRYPREITEGSIESLTGEYRWQLSPHNRHAFGGGSKLRAYRVGRSRVIHNKSYLNQYYVMFAGPKGLLP